MIDSDNRFKYSLEMAPLCGQSNFNIMGVVSKPFLSAEEPDQQVAIY